MRAIKEEGVVILSYVALFFFTKKIKKGVRFDDLRMSFIEFNSVMMVAVRRVMG